MAQLRAISCMVGVVFLSPELVASQSDCPSGQSYDWMTDACRDTMCGDIYDETNCANSPLGCEFLSDRYLCNEVCQPVPCIFIYDETECTSRTDCDFENWQCSNNGGTAPSVSGCSTGGTGDPTLVSSSTTVSVSSTGNSNGTSIATTESTATTSGDICLGGYYEPMTTTVGPDTTQGSGIGGGIESGIGGGMAGSGGGSCSSDQVYDWNTQSCRDPNCGDIFDESECAASPLGCEYLTSQYLCNEIGQPVPCTSLYEENQCSGRSDCTFENWQCNAVETTPRPLPTSCDGPGYGCVLVCPVITTNPPTETQPTTPGPTTQPTIPAPTIAPSSSSPTVAPSTSAPTTGVPTSAPTTLAPTASPTAPVLSCLGFPNSGILCVTDRGSCFEGICIDQVCRSRIVADDTVCETSLSTGSCRAGECVVAEVQTCTSDTNFQPCAVSSACREGLCRNSVCLEQYANEGTLCNTTNGINGECTGDGMCRPFTTTSTLTSTSTTATITSVTFTSTITGTSITATETTQTETTVTDTTITGTMTTTVTSATTVQKTFVYDGDLATKQEFATHPENMTATLVISGFLAISPLWSGKLSTDPTMRRAVQINIESAIKSLLNIDHALAVVTSIPASEDDLTTVEYQVRISEGTNLQASKLMDGLNNRSSYFEYQGLNYDVNFQGVEDRRFEAGRPYATMEPASSGGESPNDDSEVEAALAILFVLVLIGAVAFFAYRKLHAEKDYNLGDAELNAYETQQTLESTGGTSYVMKKKRNMHINAGGALSGDLFTIARQPQNMPKNRDGNRLPYDATLVPGPYVNASLVKGHGVRKYIATQGPLENTAVDFWRMIVAQKCKAIAMIGECFEDGQAMCHQYWPQAVGQSLDFVDETMNKVVVSCRSTETKDGIAESFLDVQVSGQMVFSVKHLHFSSWTNHSPPQDPTKLLRFREAVKSSAGDSPLAVHCDNGAGRTGAFIVFDMAIDRFQSAADDTDLADALFQVRNYRPFMIESPAQYIFVHNAFIEFLLEQPSTPAAGLTSEEMELLNRFQVPPRLYPFDIGRGGRQIIQISKCTLLPAGRLSTSNLRSDNASEPQDARIVLCSDVAIVVTEDSSGALTLYSYADRIQVRTTAVAGHANQLKVKLSRELKLQFDSESTKAEWKSILDNMDKYVRTSELSGKRLVSLKPSSRKDALRIMHIVDPNSVEGADSLRNEFEQIPTIIQPSMDYAQSLAAVQDGRTMGSTQAMSNPLYGQVVPPASPTSTAAASTLFPTVNPMNVMKGSLTGHLAEAPVADETSKPEDIAMKLHELEEELVVAEALRMRQMETERELGGYMDVSPGNNSTGGYMDIAGAQEVGGYMSVSPTPVVVPGSTAASGYMTIKPGENPTSSQLDEITRNIKLANRATADHVQKQLKTLAKTKSGSRLLDVQGESQKMMSVALSPHSPATSPVSSGSSAIERLRAKVTAAKSGSPSVPAVAPYSPTTEYVEREDYPVHEEVPRRGPPKAKLFDLTATPTPNRTPKKAWAAPEPSEESGGIALTSSARKRMSQANATGTGEISEETRKRMIASGLIVPE